MSAAAVFVDGKLRKSAIVAWKVVGEEAHIDALSVARCCKS